MLPNSFWFCIKAPVLETLMCSIWAHVYIPAVSIAPFRLPSIHGLNPKPPNK